jgi:hypothetical protein
MELEKCACYLSIWAFQKDGYAYTMTPEELGKNIIVNDIYVKPKEIKQLNSDVSQKLLGLIKNPVGNQQDEIEHLRIKSNRIATQINLSTLTTLHAKMADDSFYLPAMRYSLSITLINQMDLNTIQEKAMLSILSALGYN